MTDQEIYSKIQTTYSTEKGKAFISHLIRSFFPVNKSFFMFGFEDDKKREMKCCITNEKTFTKDDLLKHVTQSASQNVFLERLKMNAHNILKNENEPEQEASVELVQFEKEALEIKKNLSVISKLSDKVISQIAFQQLHNFVMTELLRDNKHINWLMNDERSKEFVKAGKKEGWIENRKEEKVVQKVVSHAKLSLGDNETLQRLKAKMEGK